MHPRTQEKTSGVDTTSSACGPLWDNSNSLKRVNSIHPVYVRVTGSLKSHHGKKHINATHVRLIKDLNEVYFHILEVISVNITLRKGLVRNKLWCNLRLCLSLQPPRPGQEQQQRPAVEGQSAYAIQSRPANTAAMFSPLADNVVRYLSSLPTNPEGAHVGDIAKALKADAMELR